MRISFAFILLFIFPVLGMSQSKKRAAKNETAQPFVLGEIRELQSKVLGEKRILNIYLPEGYQRNDTTRYPVIYLLDGSADEDFIHVVGLVQFNNFSWVNRVPKSIVVGIATVNRQRDFTFPTTVEADKKRWPATGGSAQFIDFLEKELQPYVEKHYQTNAGKTLIGQSLGGLLATEVLLTRPALFNRYVLVSPSLWWNDGSLLQLEPEKLKTALPHPVAVYIGVGKEGLAPTRTPHVMEVDANLLAEKLRNLGNPALTTHFDYLPLEDHATIGHQAIFNALKALHPAPQPTR